MLHSIENGVRQDARSVGIEQEDRSQSVFSSKGQGRYEGPPSAQGFIPGNSRDATRPEGTPDGSVLQRPEFATAIDCQKKFVPLPPPLKPFQGSLS
jgi:hypothetical protein